MCRCRNVDRARYTSSPPRRKRTDRPRSSSHSVDPTSLTSLAAQGIFDSVLPHCLASSSIPPAFIAPVTLGMSFEAQEEIGWCWLTIAT